MVKCGLLVQLLRGCHLSVTTVLAPAGEGDGGIRRKVGVLSNRWGGSSSRGKQSSFFVLLLVWPRPLSCIQKKEGRKLDISVLKMPTKISSRNRETGRNSKGRGGDCENAKF